MWFDTFNQWLTTFIIPDLEERSILKSKNSWNCFLYFFIHKVSFQTINMLNNLQSLGGIQNVFNLPQTLNLWFVPIATNDLQ